MKPTLLLFLLIAACPATLPVEKPEPPTDKPTTLPIDKPTPPVVITAPKATHGKCAATCDLSTDAKVGAVYKQLTGKSLEPVPKCVSRSESLPNVITVGSFFSDLGCSLNGVFVDCCYSELNEPAALLDLGWASADAKQRELLAAKFTLQVVLAFDRPISFATEDFGVTSGGKKTPSFTPLTATAKPDGSVTVEYWNNTPVGMQQPRAPGYEQWRVTFDAKGFVAGVEKITEFQGKPF